MKLKNNGGMVIAGNLTQGSDVNTKQDIVQIDTQAVLAWVMEMPISEWSYKAEPDARHIGPMAQDFYKAFELGDTETGLSTLDTSGVALAEIQALKQESVEKDVEIEVLKKQLAELKEQVALLALNNG